MQSAPPLRLFSLRNAKNFRYKTDRLNAILYNR